MIRVVAPGASSSLQDLGRFGYQHLGVGSAGAMDAWAARVANALVDNDERASVLEMTLSGAELQVCEANWFALSGADMDATCDGAQVPLCRPIWIEEGAILRFRAARRGCRAYLAVRSGFIAERVMGSTATDTRVAIGGIGGRLLQRDDVLHVASPSERTRVTRACWSTTFGTPPLTSLHVLGLLVGPAWEQLSAADRERIEREPFTLGIAADRMGLRLQESLPSAVAVPALLSQGVVFGTVQLPPDGMPIILAADRQTTGGYPVLGVVAGVDHSAIAQARSGDRILFRRCQLRDAQKAWRLREQYFYRWRLLVRAWWRELE